MFCVYDKSNEEQNTKHEKNGKVHSISDQLSYVIRRSLFDLKVFITAWPTPAMNLN